METLMTYPLVQMLLNKKQTNIQSQLSGHLNLDK